jgi:hypothetical protein
LSEERKGERMNSRKKIRILYGITFLALALMTVFFVTQRRWGSVGIQTFSYGFLAFCWFTSARKVK